MKEARANCLAIFARAPQPGQVKSRLARCLGENAAAACYAAFLRDTLELAQAAEYSPAPCQALVVYTPETAFASGPHSLQEFWRGANRPQQGHDIGERMLNCITALHADGVEHVVLIGSDSPDLKPEFLTRAFELLKTHALVFGPASDGGFYLIGANREYSAQLISLFEGVAWSSKSTLNEVLANAQRLKLPTQLLPEWSDVDTLEDLQQLSERLRHEYSRAPHTAAWLRSQNLL